MMRIILAFALCLCAGLAAAQTVEPTLSDPQDEARARALMAELRCMVCQNESIDASPSPFAGEVRAIVREQIVSGRSDDEIKTYLTDRYGEAILYRPRLTLSTILLWLTPVLALLIGAGVMHSILRWAGDMPPDL